LLILAHKLLDEEGKIAQYHRKDDTEKVADLFDPVPHLRHVGGFALFDVFLCVSPSVSDPNQRLKGSSRKTKKGPQTKREESLESRAYGLRILGGVQTIGAWR